ncbi:hypothetical protein [Streptomyces chrestomyceticus]
MPTIESGVRPAGGAEHQVGMASPRRPEQNLYERRAERLNPISLKTSVTL